MEKVAEERAAAAEGKAVEEPTRLRQGTRAFGPVCFAWYHEKPRAGLIREKEQETIVAALFDGVGCEAVDRGGRGRLQRFRLEDGWGLVRPYRRGGLMRLLLRDRYVLRNRPYRELAVHSRLYAKGLAVPEPLGVVWERRGVLFRGAIATREVDGRDLLEHLRARADGADEVLRAAGGLIRRMHDLGAYHPDLQVKNVIVGADGRVSLIDFDNARCGVPLGRFGRARNLLRFRRSLEKNGFTGLPFARVLDGYGGLSIPSWLDVAYRAKGFLSDLASGRLFRARRD